MQFRYANNSNYKNDTMIRKEGFVAQEVLDELKRIIEDAEVLGPTSLRCHQSMSCWLQLHVTLSQCCFCTDFVQIQRHIVSFCSPENSKAHLCACYLC